MKEKEYMIDWYSVYFKFKIEIFVEWVFKIMFDNLEMYNFIDEEVYI